MQGVNKAILMGRLGQDPELKTTATGKSYCRFSVATSEKWGKGDMQQKRTEWHNVVVWGSRAETCAKYLEKGKAVFVEGKIETSEWEDKQGNKQSKPQIRAMSVQFISNNTNGSGRQNQGNSGDFDTMFG